MIQMLMGIIGACTKIIHESLYFSVLKEAATGTPE
jgi:hypothetical protein